MEDPVNKALAANANDATKDSIDDVLQFSLIRDEAKQELLEALDSVRGRKCLFVDPHLGHLINQVIGDSSKFFKENAVQYYKELHGDISEFINEMNRDAPENILYLVRPHLPNMKEIAQQIRAIMQIGENKLDCSILLLNNVHRHSLSVSYLLRTKSVNCLSTSLRRTNRRP